MKKQIAILLATVFAAGSVFGCTGGAETETTGSKPEQTTVADTQEENKMVLAGHMAEMPNYTLGSSATTDEIRAAAVRAMSDELSIAWYSQKGFDYEKSGVAAGKTFTFQAMTPFAGLPYTNGSSGLFHWLRFYDLKSGELYPFDTEMLADTLGNSCYSSVTWGWASVAADSIRWKTTHEMTPQNGAIIVGDYDIGGVGNSYKDHPTPDIIQENGDQRMFEAYALVLPADALLYIPAGDGNHIRMAEEKAYTVRKEDGTIDGDESYIVYQDQWTGHLSGDGVYFNENEAGQKLHFSGHKHTKISFNTLLREGYIPITMKVFTGEEPYKVPEVTANAKEGMTIEQLSGLTVKSNYRMIYVEAKVLDANGNEVQKESHLFNRNDTEQERICFNYKLNQLIKARTIKQNLDAGTYTVIVTAQDATGTVYTIVEQAFTI